MHVVRYEKLTAVNVSGKITLAIVFELFKRKVQAGDDAKVRRRDEFTFSTPVML